MNLINSLNKFYNNLSSDGVFFFWMLVFLFAFLVFLTIVLLIKNNKLTKIILSNSQTIDKEKEHIEENKIIEEPKNLTQEEKIVPKIEEKIQNKQIHINIELPKVEENKTMEKKIPTPENIQKPNGLYQKNVLREMNAKMPTSPIHIEKDTSSFSDYLETISSEDRSVSPLLTMEDIYEPKNNSYLDEVSKKLEDEEPASSNIELTEYEKKQEEEAIISYDELQKVKDKIYKITDDEEDDEFIDELKSFRLDLQ